MLTHVMKHNSIIFYDFDISTTQTLIHVIKNDSKIATILKLQQSEC